VVGVHGASTHQANVSSTTANRKWLVKQSC
jgi:hypothetical protein